MSSRKVIRPSFHDDMEDGDVPFSQPFKKSNRDEDEFSTMSFASLNSAQEKILSKRGKGKMSKKTSKSRSKDPKAFEDNEIDSEEEYDSDSDAAPVETSSRKRGKFQKVSRKSKHAPSESSSKRPVSRVREIAGLNTRNESTLYTDIRFDPAYGVADLSRTRKDYAFLDEYRQSEIGSMERMLKDRKSTELLGEREVGDLKFKLQSLKSRLDTMKNKDLETQILADHKKKQMQSFKSGEQTNPYFLKRSEQRKLVQKAKFDTMKGSQREKVMERKRKRRLGKEFRRMEYNQQE